MEGTALQSIDCVNWESLLLSEFIVTWLAGICSALLSLDARPLAGCYPVCCGQLYTTTGLPGRSGACNGQHVPERMKERMNYSVFLPYPSGHGHPGMTNSSGIEREVAVHMDTIKIT